MTEITTATAKPAESGIPSIQSEIGTGTPTPRRPLRLVVPTIVLIVFWVATECSYRLEMGMFYRFVTRMVLLATMLIYFLGWGFTRRHFRLRERFLAFAMIVGTMFLAGSASHTSTGTPALGMIGLPIVISLSVVWLWVTRHRGTRLELTGIGLASVVVFGVISLLRWDGMDGRQRPKLSWRWTLSPEEQFLAQGGGQPFAPIPPRLPLEETADDWTSFRGGDREGVVRGIQLSDWSQTPPREAWRRRVGPGWSSMIVVGDYLWTQEQRGDDESVVCYDVNTGDVVWTHSKGDKSPERFDEKLSGTGPRATPAIHQNRIYAYGARGRFECLNAVTSERYWSHALFAMTGAPVPQWGSATSPTIVDDKVVVFTGGQNGNSLIAFDLQSGELRWQASGGAVSYSSPQVFTIAGQRQLIMHDDAGLSSFRIDDGKQLWMHPSPHEASFQPMLQPHQTADDQLLVNWDAGLLCLKVHQVNGTWQTDELWQSNRLKPSFNDFVIHDGHIYGLDDGILCCLKLDDGQRTWKKGRYGFGQMLLLPDINELLIITEQGEVVRVAANPAAHQELGRFKAIDGKTWNHPILVHGRLIVRNGEEMACFDVAQAPQEHN